MRSCIRIPRLFVAREDAKCWSVPAECRKDREMYDRVERLVGGSPSALRFLLPEFCATPSRIREIRESMYAALEFGQIEKLNRGLLFVERTTKRGVRRGIVGALDLESFCQGGGVAAGMVPSDDLSSLVSLRKACPLEFPSVMALYRDKKGKIIEALSACELEEVYSYELEEGAVKGSFIPEDWSRDVAADLHTRGDPCFVVVAGIDEFYAAKQHWEELKKGLTREQAAVHPARFVLTEFVNAYDETVELEPVHRIAADIDSAFFSILFEFLGRCKGVRQGNTFRLKNAEQGIMAERILSAFLAEHGGRRILTRAEDEASVLFCAPEKEELFSLCKAGKTLPQDAFAVKQPRYFTEGKEISYD